MVRRVRVVLRFLLVGGIYTVLAQISNQFGHLYNWPRPCCCSYRTGTESWVGHTHTGTNGACQYSQNHSHCGSVLCKPVTFSWRRPDILLVN